MAERVDALDQKAQIVASKIDGLAESGNLLKTMNLRCCSGKIRRKSRPRCPERASGAIV